MTEPAADEDATDAHDAASDTTPEALNAAPARPSPGGLSAFLTFRVAAGDYGVDILKVHEIVGLLPVTPLHGSPQAISGVVNLRGSVVPVMSLRALFNLGAGSASPHRVFIIIDHDQELIGLAVDQVLDVVRLTPAQISPPSGSGTGIDPTFIQAVGRGPGRIMTLLDIERILSFRATRAQPA